MFTVIYDVNQVRSHQAVVHKINTAQSNKLSIVMGYTAELIIDLPPQQGQRRGSAMQAELDCVQFKFFILIM